MQKEVCAHVIISGRVQGVFFRAETQQAATRIGLHGWVRNRPEGTVGALFQGPQEKVDQMLKWCWQGSPHSKVADVKVTWKACEEALTGFSIKHSF